MTDLEQIITDGQRRLRVLQGLPPDPTRWERTKDWFENDVDWWPVGLTLLAIAYTATQIVIAVAQYMLATGH